MTPCHVLLNSTSAIALGCITFPVFLDKHNNISSKNICSYWRVTTSQYVLQVLLCPSKVKRLRQSCFNQTGFGYSHGHQSPQTSPFNANAAPAMGCKSCCDFSENRVHIIGKGRLAISRTSIPAIRKDLETFLDRIRILRSPGKRLQSQNSSFSYLLLFFLLHFDWKNFDVSCLHLSFVLVFLYAVISINLENLYFYIFIQHLQIWLVLSIKNWI